MVGDVEEGSTSLEQEGVEEKPVQDEGRTAEAVEEVVPEEGVESLEKLQGELEEARRQSEEYLDQWRRTAAEFSNYRKRVEKEQAEFASQANARLIGRFLAVLDDFERAFVTVPEGLLGLTWIEGLALIYRKMQLILEGEGLEALETIGKEFDPLEHEAVTYEAVEGYEDGQVIGEVQKGYRLGDRVLRPALVRVARAPEPVREEPAAEKQPAEQVAADGAEESEGQ